MARNLTEPEYIVMIGEVGSGKSTVGEKLSGARNKSSDAATSFTKRSEMYFSHDGMLIITDTPGTNAMTDQLAHNIEVAIALNHAALSRILIVVKAHTRIDTVMSNVRCYVEQLIDLDSDMFGVIVTHMDQVEWMRDQFMDALNTQFGIEAAVFTSIEKDATELEKDILAICEKKFKLSIDDDNFFKLFKLQTNNVRIIRSGKKQINIFRSIKKSFDELRKAIPQDKQADLAFEFQAFMKEQIHEAQMIMARENNFEFVGENADLETGYIANMSNQLRAILYDIRIETMGLAALDHGVNELRKCPHCGLIWNKIGTGVKIIK